MALPMIAAGIAARAVAKKLASRAAGGITGTGAKSVNPVYKNIGSNVKVKPAAKPIGNPLNEAKAMESMLSSASRGGIGKQLGKGKDFRVANSKKLQPKLNQEKFINETKKKPPIKINSALPKRGK
jgi:hypothetical protein